MAGQRTLRIDSDADFEYGIRWGDGAGNWWQLSDVSFVVWTEGNPADLKLTANVDNGRVILGSNPDWWATILVPLNVTEDIAGGTYDFSIVATRTIDGRVRRLLEGKVVVHKAPDRTP